MFDQLMCGSGKYKTRQSNCNSKGINETFPRVYLK